MTKKSETLQLRVDPAFLEKLGAIAEEQNVPVSVLIRSWLEDRLRKELSQAQAVRVEWQKDRINFIRKTVDQTFADGPILIVHAWPLLPASHINTTSATLAGQLLPLSLTHRLPISSRINRLGYYAESAFRDKLIAMGQVFKTGQIEGILRLDYKDQEIFGLMLDNALVLMISAYCDLFGGQQVQPPYLFSVSLMRVKGYWLVTQPSVLPGLPHVEIQEDFFTIADFVLNDNAENKDPKTLAKHLRSHLDEIWQASGLEQSLSFERTGGWHGPW